MNKEELTKKALSFIVKYIKEDYDIPGEEDYNHLIFDVAREGVAIVNAVISALESANIGSAVFKKQFDERYCIEGPAIYNKEKTSLIRICPQNNVKDFVVDCNIASNAFMDCQVEKVIIKDKDVNKKDLMFATIDCTQDKVVITIKNIINTEN